MIRYRPLIRTVRGRNDDTHGLSLRYALALGSPRKRDATPIRRPHRVVIHHDILRQTTRIRAVYLPRDYLVVVSLSIIDREDRIQWCTCR